MGVCWTPEKDLLVQRRKSLTKSYCRYILAAFKLYWSIHGMWNIISLVVSKCLDSEMEWTRNNMYRTLPITIAQVLIRLGLLSGCKERPIQLKFQLIKETIELNFSWRLTIVTRLLGKSLHWLKRLKLHWLKPMCAFILYSLLLDYRYFNIKWYLVAMVERKNWIIHDRPCWTLTRYSLQHVMVKLWLI